MIIFPFSGLCVCVLCFFSPWEMIYSHSADSNWSFDFKEMQHWDWEVFVIFLTLSVCPDFLFVSVAARFLQWKLLIHFSSAVRSVPCLLIRANTKTLIRSAAWLLSNVGPLWKLLVCAQKHWGPPFALNSCSNTWKRMHKVTFLQRRLFTNSPVGPDTSSFL